MERPVGEILGWELDRWARILELDKMHFSDFRFPHWIISLMGLFGEGQ